MTANAKKKILVGLSGGVDSAVTAHRLIEAGHDVSAGFMKNYVSDDGNCPTRIDRDEAIRVAEHLGITNFFIFDLRREYDERIVRYLTESYARGITPNPDVFCNTLVKFDVFAERARSLGFDAVATGHYARVDRTLGYASLLKGVDETKDQSYFLAGLSREQLEYAEFPVGGMRKSDLRDLARKIGLPNAERPDSQGLCFIGKVNIREFLAKHIELHPGNIVDTSGRVLGRHEGIEIYTLGQRKGIGVGGGPARFVVAKDMATHTLVVGDEHDPALLSDSCRVERWRWIEPPRSGAFRAGVKIRYRQPDQGAEAEIAADGTGTIRFDAPQRAVTPGQVAAVYDGDRVVGSGEIVA